MMMPRMQEVFPDHDMASLQSALITSEFNINHASRLILGGKLLLNQLLMHIFF